MTIRIGVQLFSLREEMKKDPVEALQKTLELGYRYLEPLNDQADRDPIIGCGVSAETLADLLASYDAGLCGVHMSPLSMETVPTLAMKQRALGNRNIIKGFMFWTGYDSLMRNCEEFNRIGQYLVEHDMNPLHYHNHYHEFQHLNGKEILYHIAENTDPKFLHFELDVAWAKRAGRDPVREMTYFGKRLRLLHIKDFTSNPVNMLTGKDKLIDGDTFGVVPSSGDEDATGSGEIVPMGTGIMPLQAIIDKANELGVEYAILEQGGSTGDVFENLRISFENMKKIKGL